MFDGSSKWMKLGDLKNLAGLLGAYVGNPQDPPSLLPNDLWCNPDMTNGLISSF
jgi:hypothetical protein